MKHKLIFCLVLTLNVMGCHILNKDKQTLKRLNQKEELHVFENRHLLKQQSQLMLMDSSYSDFTMMLWPKGKFTLSATNGFEGEAEKVVIASKNKTVSAVEAKREITEDNSERATRYTKEKEHSTATAKTKNKMVFNWMWLLLLPVLYFAYRLCRWLKTSQFRRLLTMYL